MADARCEPQTDQYALNNRFLFFAEDEVQNAAKKGQKDDNNDPNNFVVAVKIAFQNIYQSNNHENQ